MTRARYEIKKVNTLDGPRYYVLKVTSAQSGWSFTREGADKIVKELRAKK